jgi:hypothetical protein
MKKEAIDNKTGFFSSGAHSVNLLSAVCTFFSVPQHFLRDEIPLYFGRERLVRHHHIYETHICAHFFSFHLPFSFSRKVKYPIPER